MFRKIVGLGFSVLIFSLAACNRQAAEPSFTPGLGEIMTLTQMRHIKLWFAGQGGNWPLAAYELDEINEGLDDAAKFHPTHKDAPLPIPDLITKIMTAPMKQLEEAVHVQNKEQFSKAFDDLTTACNSCHQATNFGFNVVTRPASNPYANQLFEPSH